MNKAMKTQKPRKTVYMFSEVILPSFIISQFSGRIFIEKEIICSKVIKIHGKIRQQVHLVGLEVSTLGLN